MVLLGRRAISSPVRVGVAVNDVVPDKIEGGGDEPQIAPCQPRCLLLHGGRIDLPDIQQQRQEQHRLHRQHHQGEGPAVGLHRQRREQLSLQALGGDHHQIGQIRDHQQGKQRLAGIGPHRQKVEHGVQPRADGAEKAAPPRREEGSAQAQSHLQQRQHCHQRRRHRRRKPQPPPEGIEGHGQKGQEVRQRINADLQHPIQRRHQSTPSFRSRSKRKAEYASCISRNLRRLMGRRVPSFSRNTSSCRPATSWKFTTTPRQMPQKHG